MAMAGGLEVANNLTPYGFVVVLVDGRGSGASFGQRAAVMMRQVVADMGDVIDWIVAQPWSNGRVGATGVSAVGMTAEWLTTIHHPALRAIMPRFTIFDVFGGTHPGGLTPSTFMQDIGRMLHCMDANRLAEMSESPVQRLALRAMVRGVQHCDEDPDRRMLAQAAADHAANQYLDVDLVAVKHRDDPMPSEPESTVDVQSPFRYAEAMASSGAAIYAEAGWGDGGFIREMISLHNTVRGPHSRLLIGPWPHGGRWYASPLVEKATRTQFDHFGEMARFFDLHLRDVDDGIASEPPIHYFTTGEEKWKTADCWPPSATDQRRYYLAPGRVLSTSWAAEAHRDHHRFDLTATTGPDSRYGRHLAGGRYPVRYPDRAQRDRALLAYDSGPLERDTEVTGSPVVHLVASFSTADAAVFAYLEDVEPDGVVRHVTDGMLSVGCRAVSDEPAPYWLPGPWRSLQKDEWRPATPGEEVELSFDLYPTSHLFFAGHRIRLAIAGADVDTIMPLTTGEAPEIDLCVGGPGSSSIELPILPR
jgi:putative CocE/NonD family hydrolase